MATADCGWSTRLLPRHLRADPISPSHLPFPQPKHFSCLFYPRISTAGAAQDSAARAAARLVQAYPSGWMMYSEWELVNSLLGPALQEFQPAAWQAAAFLISIAPVPFQNVRVRFLLQRAFL